MATKVDTVNNHDMKTKTDRDIRHFLDVDSSSMLEFSLFLALVEHLNVNHTAAFFNPKNSR